MSKSKRKEYMIAAEKAMLMVLAAYGLEHELQSPPWSSVKSAMTRGQGFALAAIRKEVCGRLKIKNDHKAKNHPLFALTESEVLKEIGNDVQSFWLRQQNS